MIGAWKGPPLIAGRFGLLFLNRGKWNDKQIVPESWVDQATIAQGPQDQPGHLYPGYPMGR